MRYRKLSQELQPYRVSAVKYLSKLGLNNEEVGVVLGVTREAVRKLLLKRAKSSTIIKN